MSSRGSPVNLGLVVAVKENTPLGTIITNSVKIESDETEPNEAYVDLHIGEPEPMKVADVRITPSVLRRNGTSRNIKVEMYPREFKKSDIDPSDRPELWYQNERIDKKNQSISGSEDRPKTMENSN